MREDINKKNLEETKMIMDKATSKKSDDWDCNNPFIKIIMSALLIFIIIGSIIIFINYLLS